MKKYAIILSVIGTLLFPNCNRRYEMEYERITHKYFVSYYTDIKEINLKRTGIDKCLFSIECRVDPVSTPEINETLQKKHENGWNIYNRVIKGSSPEHIYCYYGISSDFQSIRITSDRPFGDDYQAGESLNSEVRFMSVSPFDFIRSGYSKPFTSLTPEDGRVADIFYKSWCEFYSNFFVYRFYNNYISDNFWRRATAFYPIEKLSSELSSDDMILLGGGMYRYNKLTDIRSCNLAYLYFEDPPEGTYKINVELVDKSGRVFSANFIANF